MISESEFLILRNLITWHTAILGAMALIFLIVGLSKQFRSRLVFTVPSLLITMAMSLYVWGVFRGQHN